MSRRPLKEMTKKQKWARLAVSAAAALFCVLFAALHMDMLREAPWTPALHTDYMSDFAANGWGWGALIDQSKNRLMMVMENPDGGFVYQWSRTGGNRSQDGFYTAVDLAVDADGQVFVTDLILGLDGSTVEGEKILCFGRDGKYLGTPFSVSYEEGERPAGKGRIYALTVSERFLLFLYREDDALKLCRAAPFGNGWSYRELWEVACDTRGFVSFAIGGEGETVYCATKDAGIQSVTKDGRWETLYRGEEHSENGYYSVPWGLCTDSRSGEIYFSDIGLRRISAVGPSGEVRYVSGCSDTERLSEYPIDYVVHNVPDGGGMTTSSDDLGAITYPAEYRTLRCLVWVSLAVFALALIYIIRVALSFSIHISLSDLGRNSLIIFAVAAIVSVATTSLVMNNMQNRYTDEVMNRISAAADLAGRSLTPEYIMAIDTPQDYNTAEYQKLRQEILDCFENGGEWSKGLYCVLNRVDAHKIIYSCLYLEDTVGSYYPLDYPYEGLEYQELYETGKQVRFDDISNSDGNWLYVLTPVFDRDGTVIAAMEVGTNLSAFQESTNLLIWELILNVVSLSAVIVLVFTEWVSFTYLGREKRRRVQASDNQERETRRLAVEVVRPIIFVVFTADCLATAFLPILTSQIAEPFLGLSAEFMSAVPISAELLLTAVFAFAGGRIIERAGIRTVMLTGCLVSAAGFVAAGASNALGLFTLAKCLIGAGVGLVMISCNTLVADFPDEERDRGFSFYNAGSLAGITVGTTIGSFLVAWLGYFHVYYVAAGLAVLAAGAVLAGIKKDYILPPPPPKTADSPKSRGLLPFLVQRRVLWYFVGAMMPYILFGYFFTYFVPLFAEGEGMSEAAIGQLFLLNGLCVIYFGPALTKLMLHKVGPRVSILLSGGVYIAALLLFSLFPGVPMITVSALLFGVADSFGLSALSVYFSGLPEVQGYGSGRSMGLSNTLENTAQCAGPFVFSALYAVGVQRGLALLTAAFCLLLALFFLSSRKGKV